MSKKLFFTLYMLFLGSLIGAIILVAFSAAIIFNANDYLGSFVLSHYQSGLIMTQIFIKFNYLLVAVLVLMVIYEALEVIKKNINYFVLILVIAILITSLLFIFYYTPYILEAQSLGEEATKSKEFDSMHKASEIDFKILLFATIGLFGIRTKD